MNWKKQVQAFQMYAKEYSNTNPKVKLKIVHTFHVVENAEIIAINSGLSKEDIQLAKTIALLHDIGRFEQIRRYNDFRDRYMVDHADIGVEILKENNLIRKFVAEDTNDNLIFTAIQYHNKYAIPKGLDAHAELHAKIIRDADKLDIFRVWMEEPLTASLPCPLFIDPKEWTTDAYVENIIQEDTISDIVLERFEQHTCLRHEEKKTVADVWVGCLSMLFDLNQKAALQLMDERNCINRLLDRFMYQRKETKERVEKIRTILKEYVHKMIQNEQNS